jgi:hypothetical protein
LEDTEAEKRRGAELRGQSKDVLHESILTSRVDVVFSLDHRELGVIRIDLDGCLGIDGFKHFINVDVRRTDYLSRKLQASPDVVIGEVADQSRHVTRVDENGLNAAG